MGTHAPAAWGAEYAALSTADRDGTLERDGLERLAVAAYLVGREDESTDLWARAHQQWLSQGDAARAARCAFWLAFTLLNRGDMARGGGWLSRAQRVLDQAQLDCVERGFLLLPAAIGAAEEGDVAAALTLFIRAAEMGQRFSDPCLQALAWLGQGRVLMRSGEITRGAALLDEVMVAVTAGELPPIVVGDIYCTAIEAFQEVFDLHRAQEWTAVLTRWCDAQPDLVPYRGQCLVHRAQILAVHGVWEEAIAEARRACEILTRPPGHLAAGLAYYQLGDLHRLRGEFADAEWAYSTASEAGMMPQPGFALLRLAQHDVSSAGAAVRAAFSSAEDRLTRARLLAPYVEIVLAAEDVPAARSAAEELQSIAAEFRAPYLLASSAHAWGAVHCVEGDPQSALAPLRKALALWRSLDAPYEAARTRVLIGCACRDLNDADGFQLEMSAAGRIFTQLNAAPDAQRVDELLGKRRASAAGGLTGREVEVLRLVAAGHSNRDIANSLVISEKTVARHLSNIFNKLGLASRAAATAHAYKHGLV